MNDHVHPVLAETVNRFFVVTGNIRAPEKDQRSAEKTAVELARNGSSARVIGPDGTCWGWYFPRRSN